jgi:hypothetical protein
LISSEKADGPSIQTKKTIPRQVSGKSWPPLVAHVVRRGTAESSRTCRRSRRERRGKRRRRSRRSANNCSESKLQRQSIEAAKISRHTDDPSGGRSAGPRGLVTAPFRRASLRRPGGRSPHPDESCWLNVEILLSLCGTEHSISQNKSDERSRIQQCHELLVPTHNAGLIEHHGPIIKENAAAIRHEANWSGTAQVASNRGARCSLARRRVAAVVPTAL